MRLLLPLRRLPHLPSHFFISSDTGARRRASRTDLLLENVFVLGDPQERIRYNDIPSGEQVVVGVST
jgi:hypothetical protein